MYRSRWIVTPNIPISLWIRSWFGQAQLERTNENDGTLTDRCWWCTGWSLQDGRHHEPLRRRSTPTSQYPRTRSTTTTATSLQAVVNNKHKPAIVESNFAHRAAIRQTRRNIRVVFYSGPLSPSCENMTSSTKPEQHNPLDCRQRRTVHGHRQHVQGGPKIGTILYALTLRTYNITDFQKYFTVRIRRKFAIKIPPHLNCVAILPCEMTSVLKATTENKTTSLTTQFKILTTGNKLNNVLIVSVIVQSNCHILQFLHQMFNVSALLLYRKLDEIWTLVF